MNQDVEPQGTRLTSRRGIIGCALLLGVIMLAGCSKGHEQRPGAKDELPVAQVKTQQVESKDMAALEEVVGTVRAKLRAVVEAKTSGRVTEIPVVLGQKVKAGDLLARLDAPEIKARLEQAQAGLQQAEREWKRASALFEQQAATRADYDAADSRYLIAKGAVAEAQALLSYVEIRAPFDGVVTRKWVDVGDLAAPGKPLIDLEDPSKMQLEAEVPEAIVAGVRQEERLAIRLGYEAGDIVGTVAEISPVADPGSRTFRVKLDFPEGAKVMSGQFARLAVPVGNATLLRVPASAVVQRGQMEIVFGVEDQRARLHLVRTGRRVNDDVEVLSGLNSGDSVVIENPNQLVDGQPLQIR